MQTSDILITDFNEFEEIIKSIEGSVNRLKDMFNSENQNMERISGANTTWTGSAQKVMYEKYKYLTENFPGIEASCEVYIHFLKKTLDDYKAMVAAINANTDDMSESLNVNS